MPAAGLMVVTSRSVGWEPSLLVLPVMALVFISYRLHLGRRGMTAIHSLGVYLRCRNLTTMSPVATMSTVP